MIILRRVTGQSMLPALKPGKVVLALRSRRFKSGDIVIVRHNGLEKIKRIKRVRGGEVFVTGDNPMQSTDSRSFGWLERGSVLGKVVRLKRLKLSEFYRNYLRS